MAVSAEPVSASPPALDPRVWSALDRVMFFPVRHHSPACARLVREAIETHRPTTVLIEGPSDFNPRFQELQAEHRLPISLYSYFATDDGTRCGAFYPFCDFSPEWVAIQSARAIGAKAAFIDLPWTDVAALDRTANRYSDGRLARNAYTNELCRRLGVDDWNTLWDTLFEIDPTLSLSDFLQRCHSFCYHARVADGGASEADLAREGFMAERIREAVTKTRGQVLVVTGGFHSPALFAALQGARFEPPIPLDPLESEPEPPPTITERGLSLTPYSYERFDSLAGYNAGLPNPGFYHQIWRDRNARSTKSHSSYRSLLSEAVKSLRKRGQTASTADLIAVETSANALAELRGHAVVWRTDLVDALLGGLVKDELLGSGQHPFLDSLHRVFRGSVRGQLADGTPLPPLVADIKTSLSNQELELENLERTIELSLDNPLDLQRSRVLHRLRTLGIPGFVRKNGTDFVSRTDLSRLWESWSLRWSPEFESACIESSIYGASLLDAAGARLFEQASKLERDAEAAARLLLDATLAGWPEGFRQLHDRVVALVRTDASFSQVARALGHLFYLYRHNESIGDDVRPEIAALLTEVYQRALWLLEAQAPAADAECLRGLRALLFSVHVAGPVLNWDRGELVSVLQRLGSAISAPPLLRGASAGALWSLGITDLTAVLRSLPSEPTTVGDFLQGVFALAREEAQRNADLLVAVDQLLLEYDDERFLVALPSLRLAFTYFTPREKDHLARRLLQAVGQSATVPLPALAVTPEAAARAFAFESRLFRERGRHGLRGGTHTPSSP